MKLKNKVAIITGASSGIGRAIALSFAREGATVVLSDIRKDPIEGGEQTLELIKQAGGNAVYENLDVSCWENHDRVVSATVKLYGKLDVMVNNAAIYTGTKLTETDEAHWDTVMAVNLKGVFLGCKRAVQQMLQQEIINEARGRIINISSQHGMISCPGDIAYGVSKSGVVYMTRQIASDYGVDNIICNAVAPGKILTGRTDAISSEAITYSTNRTPLPRLGAPNDVANAAVFLASDQCTYMTGVNLMVDGGWSAA